MPRDFLVSLLFMLGMKACAPLDSAMSERIGRGLLLEMMGSGDVWYEGSRHAEDFIRGDCLVWLGKRGLPVLSLSCRPHIGHYWEAPLDTAMTSERVVAVARNSRKLKALHLRGWTEGFTAAHMAQIAAHCQDVETLDFADCGPGITDEVVIAAASGMHKLKNVNLYSCQVITNASLVALSSHCPHIIKADFSYCRQITDEGLISFTQGCLLIEDLKLYYVDEITDLGIKAIANGCRFTLKSLNVSWCNLITDESIKLLAQQCSLLQKIDISYCDRLTDVALKHLANLCPALSDVNIHGSRRMTDEAVIHLVRTRGSSIRFLYIGSCPLLTDLSVIAIADNCPHLVKLDCSLIDNITDMSVMRLAEGCKELTHVNLYACK